MSEALLKKGLIYYNKSQDDLALAAFDKVVKDYGNSKNAKEALEKIRKIYVDKGDITAFEKYIDGVPFADISKSRLDSTSYEIAQNSYLSGDCKGATKNLSNYISKYPKGVFALNAHFYRADCEYKNSFYNEALLDYKVVLTAPKNKFTEDATYATSFIYKALNDTVKAIASFVKLEQIAEKPANRFDAQYNLMELYFMNKNYDKAFTYAEVILASEKLDVKLMEEVKLIKAKIDFTRENYDSAIATYTDVSKYSNKRGAEAKYMVAKIRYLKGNYKGCEEMVYKLVNQVPSYPKWIGKGFILLADNFLAQEDVFNAKVTLQSVIDNADDAELIQIAKEKLNIIIKSEKEEQTKEKKEAPQIELIENDSKDEKLFNEQSQSDKKEGKDEE
jgi:TolA-binding protein